MVCHRMCNMLITHTHKKAHFITIYWSNDVQSPDKFDVCNLITFPFKSKELLLIFL